MDDIEDSRRRCSTCGSFIEGVSTLMVLPRDLVLDRYQDGPPQGIPNGVDTAFIVDPCGHEMTLLQLREAGVEVERYEHPDKP